MLGVEGLDMYVHGKKRNSVWVARYGHAGEGWNRLHRHKHEGYALRRKNGLDEFFRVILALMVVEGEVLNNFPRFVGIFIAEFVAGGAVNLAVEMKGDMIMKNLDLKPTIDAMMRDILDFEVLPGGRIEQGIG
ncbi:hypothetical protein Tco_1471282 [Tanacetum coccineum]